MKSKPCEMYYLKGTMHVQLRPLHKFTVTAETITLNSQSNLYAADISNFNFITFRGKPFPNYSHTCEIYIHLGIFCLSLTGNLP